MSFNQFTVSTDRHENSNLYKVTLRWRDQSIELPFLMDKTRADALRGQTHQMLAKLFALNGGTIVNGCTLEEVRW